MSETEIIPEKSPCWVLLGPTASGKTAVSLEIAKDYPVEIISVDSMQVYQRMNIGTATPDPEERERVRHHMINIVDPAEEYNAAKFREKAVEAVGEIRTRDHIPLLLCGTPFYLKALLWGLFEGPGSDEEIRERLRKEVEQHGPEYLHERLAEIDPESAERIDPNDVKRVERALEVYEITGEPISQRQDQFAGEPIIDHISVGLKWNRQKLYDRIESRVEQMLDRGLEEEVRSLMGQLGPQSGQAVGYKELISYLEGDIPYEEAVRLIKRNSRHLAKSQINWFKRFPVEKWVDVTPASRASDIAEECARVFVDQSAHPCTDRPN